MDFQIRKFHIRDYNSLIKLWDESKLSYRPKGRDSRKELNRQAKLPFINILVVEKDKIIIGSIIGSHDGRRGWINRLAVHPQYQRKSIAKRLVKEIEKWFHGKNIKIICSLIEDWNKTSMQVFKRFGYIEHSDIIYFSKRKSLDV